MVLLSLLWAVLNVVLLLAELASLAFVQLSAETHLYKMVQPVPERLEFHLVDNLIDKGKFKEQFCFLGTYAALLHVEEGSIVELSDGGAVVALYIVGVNLQHRLSEHPGLLGGAEILIGLLRQRLLGTVADENLSGEGTDRSIVKDILVELIARAVAHLMVDEGVVVDVLLLVGDNTAVA